MQAQVSALLLVTGSRSADRTIGFIGVRSDGPASGRPSRLRPVVRVRKCVDVPTMILLTVNAAESCDDSGVGWWAS